MLQKPVEKSGVCCQPGASDSHAVQGCFCASDGMVIHAAIIPNRTPKEARIVRLIPKLEVPGADFFGAPLLDAVRNSGADELLPLVVIFGRITPQIGAGVIVHWLRFWGIRQDIGHEAKLHDRFAIVGKKGFENLVQYRKVQFHAGCIDCRAHVCRALRWRGQRITRSKGVMTANIVGLF